MSELQTIWTKKSASIWADSCKEVSVKILKAVSSRWARPSILVRGTTSLLSGVAIFRSCSDRRISSAKNSSSIYRSISPFTQPSWEHRMPRIERKTSDVSLKTSSSTSIQEGRTCHVQASFSSSMRFHMCKTRCNIQRSERFVLKSGQLSYAINLKNSLSSICRKTKRPQSSIGTQIIRKSSLEEVQIWVQEYLLTLRNSKKNLCLCNVTMSFLRRKKSMPSQL